MGLLREWIPLKDVPGLIERSYQVQGLEQALEAQYRRNQQFIDRWIEDARLIRYISGLRDELTCELDKRLKPASIKIGLGHGFVAVARRE